MKKALAGRVPVLESAFEIKLPWLLKQAKAMHTNTLVITDGDIRTVVELTPTRLATKLGGQVWVVDIVPVPCLGRRVRPLLKCPRAHEGNFQSLYYQAGQLACRHCHRLRYASNLAASTQARSNIQRLKLERNLCFTRNGKPRRPAGAHHKTFMYTLNKYAAYLACYSATLKQATSRAAFAKRRAPNGSLNAAGRSNSRFNPS